MFKVSDDVDFLWGFLTYILADIPGNNYSQLVTATTISYSDLLVKV